MFFIRNKKIVIDCFTSDKSVYDFASIQKASNFYPSWFKKMPSSYEVNNHLSPTIKTCDGLINYYQHGMIIPLWSDLSIRIEEKKYFWFFSDNKTMAESHNSQQWQNYTDPSNVAHLKIISPWAFKCKEKIMFLFKKPYWNFEPFIDIDIVDGITDYKYQTTTNINMFLKINQNKRIDIKFKTPIAHIIPLSDRDIEIRNHLVDMKEFSNIHSTPILTFLNNYQSVKKEKIKNEKKCPFGS